jgi:3-deoxy-manno-octulosonate cytidylyltransferase (CMP-KDO synthetase)
VVEAEGGRAVLTAPELPSGSDRVFSALETIDPSGPGPGSTPVHDVVVNLQGDLPTIPPENIRAAVEALGPPGPPGGAADIGTLAAPLAARDGWAEREDANVVKVALALAQGERRGRALAFSRAADPVAGAELFHHIGIYAYRRAALARFVRLPKSEAEMAQGLEQLRAMEAGMRIDVGVVDSVPLGVDTPADLERAREILG